MRINPARNAALLLTVRADKARALVRGKLETTARLLEAEIKQQLSTPGQGRWYARARQRGSNSATAEARRKKFNRRLGQVAYHLNAGAPIDVAKATELRNLHRASAPYDPPAPDTGDLRRSTFAEPMANGGWLVGVAMAYARWLEFGTERMSPRPFMRPALAAIIARLRGKA